MNVIEIPYFSESIYSLFIISIIAKEDIIGCSKNRIIKRPENYINFLIMLKKFKIFLFKQNEKILIEIVNT